MRFPTMWYVWPAKPQISLHICAVWSACAYAQSDQSLCYSLEYSMNTKLLTEHHLEFLSLKGDCKGSSKSTLVKMPHCWKSHVTAQCIIEGLHCSLSSWAGLNDAYSGLQVYGGPGSLSHDFKYGPSLSKTMGPVDPSFLAVKMSHFNKKYSSYSEATNSTKYKYM